MHKINKVLAKIAVALAVAMACTPAQAADKELLDILLGNGAITETQYEELLKKKELTSEDAAVITLGNGGGLSISTPDGSTAVGIGGRLHLDYTNHDYDRRIGTAPISGTQVRRGRIEFDGVFDTHWAWAAEFDYAQNQVEIKDIKIGYVTERGSEFYAGHQKQPYSLSLEMSSNDEPFVERSVDNALVAALTDRAIGIRAETSGDHWFVAGGLFGDTIKTGGAGKEGWGASGRAVYTPILQPDKVLHLGWRASYREIEAGTPPLKIRDMTTDFSELSIVNTNAMNDAESATLLGPEFAAAWGPLYVFGEYTRAGMDNGLSPDLDFDAWHIAATWTLTGESYAKRYRLDEGEFKNIRPTRNFDLANGAPGAWELGLRYASIDLNDGAFLGGEETVSSLALNWYINRNVRMMFDWSHILDTDESSPVRLFAPGMNVYTVRSQYNF